MTALLIIIAAIVLLLAGYIFYGSWLAKQWGIDPAKKTPAHEKTDGVDYVPAKPAVLMGHCRFDGTPLLIYCRCRSN